MTDPSIDTSLAYKVEAYGGVAWRVEGYVTTRDEDYEEVVDYERVKAHMIGDDRVFELDVSDLTPIDDSEYCPECGQIGCKAYG